MVTPLKSPEMATPSKPPIRIHEPIPSTFVTGDAVAVQPALMKNFRVPKFRAIEGKGTVARFKQQTLDDLEAKCRNTAPANQSSIFYGINMMVQHLRSQGFGANSNCILFVQSDGKETVDALVSKAINSSDKKFTLPEPVDNTGIKIVFVGMAQSKDASTSAAKNRNTSRIDRLQKIWLALFTHPEQVSFEPYCDSASSPDSKAPAAATASGKAQ